MSTSTLKVGPELASSLGDCEVGEIKTLSVTGTVTAIADDGSVVMDVDNVAYEPEEGDEEDYEEPEKAPSKRDKVPSAVLMLLGKGK